MHQSLKDVFEFFELFDYVIVFPTKILDNDQTFQSGKFKQIISTLIESGFEVYLFLSASKNKIFALINCKVLFL
jgi:hypothetical protein